jgi:hypothetical protein
VSNVSPLADLIEEVQRNFLDRHGVQLTHSDIARRSGGVIKRNQVGRWTREPIKDMPAPETLRALAAGLGVAEALVTRRALMSAGYVVPTTDAEPVSKIG